MHLLRPSLLAFDLGLGRVEGARIRRAGGKFRFEEFGAESFAEANSEVVWLDSVVPALAKLGQRQRWRGQCVVSLPGLVSLTKSIALPAGATASRVFRAGDDATVDRLVADQVPVPSESVVWSAARGDAGDEAILAVVKLSVIRSILAAFASLGLEVERVIPQALALHDGFDLLHDHREAPAIFAYANGPAAQLIFSGMGGTVFRTVRIPPLPGPDARGRTSDQRLAESVSRTIADRPVPDAATAPDGIHLAGVEPGVASLAGILAATCSVPVTRCVAPPSLEFSPAASDALAGQSGDAWIGLAGQARPLMGRGQAGINLLPPAEIRSARIRKTGRTLTAVGAVLALMIAFPAAHYRQRAAAAVAELDRQEEAMARLRRQQAVRERLAAEADRLQQRIAGFARVEEASLGWLDFMTRLEAEFAAVECVWLDRFVVERARARPVAPSGANSLRSKRGRGSEPVAAIEQPKDEIRLSGRILDLTTPPGAHVASAAYARGQELLSRLKEIPVVNAVTSERFEPGPDALLRFEVTLRLQPDSLL